MGIFIEKFFCKQWPKNFDFSSLVSSKQENLKYIFKNFPCLSSLILFIQKKRRGKFYKFCPSLHFFPIYLNIMAAGNKWKVFSSRTRSNIFICPLTGVCPRFDRKWKVVKNTLLRWFLLYVMYKNYPHVMLPLINFSMLEFKARK